MKQSARILTTAGRFILAVVGKIQKFEKKFCSSKYLENYASSSKYNLKDFKKDNAAICSQKCSLKNQISILLEIYIVADNVAINFIFYAIASLIIASFRTKNNYTIVKPSFRTVSYAAESFISNTAIKIEFMYYTQMAL